MKASCILDTPGILWPKFEDPEVGLHLGPTPGAVKDDILDAEELAVRLMELLRARYPQALEDRYKLEALPENPGATPFWRQQAGSGASCWPREIDTERMARVLLEEFRSCKLGRFTLEMPEESL